MDINTKKLKKNAFRVSKVRGLTASRVRVPGGCCNADVMQQVVDIARKYGNGQIHVTTRQGFEIEGIHMEDMDEVNEMLQPIIDNLQINQNEAGTGYPASGTRNVCACIGNRVCPFGNYNTAAFAKRIEKAIFPNDLHFKIALTGCANDCIKARMHDFGIIGMTEPQYDPNRCVSCGACVKGCDKLSVDALKMENYRIVRNEEKCVGCGLCAKACPQHLIQVVPTENTIQPQCANLDKGPKAIQGCAVSCIGCRICEKYCPCKAIKVVDNHAVICQEKCIACGMCAVKCPRGVIHDKNGILSIR